jgi:hypothetical protein
MRCARCAGLRVPEILYEGGARVGALRCIHCGDVIDPMIVRNRRRVRQSPMVGRKAEGRLRVIMALRSGPRMRDTRSRMEEKGGRYETDSGDVLFLRKSSRRLRD